MRDSCRRSGEQMYSIGDTGALESGHPVKLNRVYAGADSELIGMRACTISGRLTSQQADRK